METKMKNSITNSLWKWALGVCMLFVGMQSAWAGCAGTVYFKAPSDWTQAVFSGTNNDTPLVIKTRDENGYFVADVADIGLEASFNTFSIANKTGKGNILVLDTVWNYNNAYDDNAHKNMAKLTCPGAGNKIYVMQDPLSDGKTFVGSEPSDAKFFYFLVPQDEAWQSDNVIIRINGSKDTAMVPAPDMCGWYYMAFGGSSVPTSIVMFRKNDPTDQLGLKGMAETGDATPIALATFYNTFKTNTLYFVPDDADWTTDELITNSGWATVDPGIPEAGDIDRCSYNLAALIYDTDKELNSYFTDSESDKDETCVGVRKGIVNVDLDPVTKKPKFSGSANAKKCFGDESVFNKLFNYDPTANEVQCYDMPFRHYGKDSRWGFDSDSTNIGGKIGGFYPLEHEGDTYDNSGNVTSGAVGDANVVVVNGVALGPNWKARKKRKAEAPVPLQDTVKNFDQYCSTPGWPGGIDCDNKFNNGESPAVWNWGVRQDWTGVTRNQHFCFESHAKFTYYEDQEFTFRGDDDIWVFINNKLVVDAGGPHLATPGHVVLKNLNTTYGAGFLVPGIEYDLDIFFCDRRTTMSNVIIKTNMYIRQKSDISLTRDKNVTGSKSYDVCYSESGAGNCAAALSNDEGLSCCGSDFTTKAECKKLEVSYWLVEGRKIADSASTKSVKITTPGTYNCIIDVSNMVKPNVGNQEDICGLGTGRYTLFMNIKNLENGTTKHKQVATFRPKGDVDVVYRDAVALDTNGTKMAGGDYKAVKSAMAGEWVPVYVTNVHEPDKSSDPLEMLPQDAAGVQYTLNAPGLMVCVAVAEDGTCATLMDETNSTRTIGPSGVDTVYVTVDMNDLTASTDFKINVVGKTTSQTITFFLPIIMFIEAVPDSGKLPVEKPGEVPNADGSYEDYWVGGRYDFAMAIFKPDGNGGAILCPECELTVHRGNNTSEQVVFNEVTFKNGYAIITVMSTKEYRSSLNNPAIIEVSNDLGNVKAQYTPVFFKEPPVPTPRLADIFDVRGATPSIEFNIPAPYFSMSQEYLDGIADSVAIYYHRPFHRDSLPTKICVAWDSSLVDVDSLWHNPYKEGFSTVLKDTSIFCNVLLSDGNQHIDCSKATDADPYCTNKVKVGGLKLSANIKTGGSGKLISYAEFMEEDASGKKKEVKQGFPTNLVDRIAPIPVRAEVRNVKKGDDRTDNDELIVIMSEPVKLVATTNKLSALDFYLTSSADLAENQRYASVMGAATVVTAPMEPTLSTTTEGQGSISIIYNNKNLSPQVDDYARLTGNLASVYWSDDADINVLGSDTLRDPADDAKFHWNSPTGLDEVSTRLPSPWVAISGEAKGYTDENKFAHTGNVPAGDKVPAFSVNAFSSNKSFQDILSDPEVAGKPGQWLHPGMLRAYNALPDSVRKDVDPKEIYVQYEVQYFTNLGNYVAGTKGKIYCDDTKNDVKYFNGGLCTETNDMHFFFGWNMRSDKGRTVGTGAYIMKFNSFIKLGSAGKDYKIDETSVYGVKRSNKPYVGYLNAGEDK